MKTINYTGSSKLISRIVHLLNRKAPLPLDGDGDAVWGTNGQVLTTDGQGNTSWTTPQGGGGDVTDVEVNGTSVVNAQGVAEVSVPTATSDLNNDSGFITNLVNNLANYYTKSQTYTQAEVDALISGIVTLNILVVQTLPTQDISTTTIYLVPKQDAGTDDIYDEYLYINNAWELIGTTQIDLSNYVTTTDLSTALADYVTSVGLATILAGYVQSSDLSTVATSGSYNDLSNKPTIPAAQVNSDWNAASGVAQILNKPSLATVATSGSYNDLSNKPTIPAAQIQSDWNQSDTTAKDYIKNKPTIPTVTKTVFYGTCTGQAANQTKAVVVDSSQGFALTAGIILLVKFDANNTYSATADAPVKLKVNTTAAKNVYYAGSNAPTGTNTTAFGRTNYVNQYYYDGTNWIWSGSSADNNTTYSNMSASELTTGTATTARSISAKVLTDWLVAKLTNVAYKNVDNAFSANQTLDSASGTTTTVGSSVIRIGNYIQEGVAGNSAGNILLCGKGSHHVQVYADAVTTTRTAMFPDKSGTIAMTRDISDTVSLTASGVSGAPVLQKGMYKRFGNLVVFFAEVVASNSSGTSLPICSGMPTSARQNEDFIGCENNVGNVAPKIYGFRIYGGNLYLNNLPSGTVFISVSGCYITNS